MRATDPLPFVPVMWMTEQLWCGSPNTSSSRPHPIERQPLPPCPAVASRLVC